MAAICFLAGVCVIRVLVVDDQPVVRSGMRMILDNEVGIEVVGEAESGKQAINYVTDLHPDVVLLDLRMPDMDGISVTRILTELPNPPRIIIVTAYDPDEYVFDSLSAGASGFLLKSESPDRFIEAVRAVHAGESLFSPVVTRQLVERFVHTSQAEKKPSSITSLTIRETDVLLKVSQGMSNKEIATELFISVGTVKTHVANILLKLNVRDRLQAVVFAYETGLVRPGGMANK